MNEHSTSDKELASPAPLRRRTLTITTIPVDTHDPFELEDGLDSDHGNDTNDEAQPSEATPDRSE
eukprot:6518076-Heterocapsa_arctica.AAC.1